MAAPKKPRKRSPTRAQIERTRKLATHRVPLELVLEWDRPVSVAEARQEARRLLEALNLDASGFCPKEPFAQARIQVVRAARTLHVHHGPVSPE